MKELKTERTDPGTLTQEREMLDQWLDYHRATLLQKCSGLSNDQLQSRSCPPSSLSLLGLVRHMTEVERGWFYRGVLRKSKTEVPPLYYSDDNPDGDFNDVDSVGVDEVFATYQSTIDDIRRAVVGVGLDDTFNGDTRSYSVRWVYLHMIEEYARHNGHSDLLRERIDGVTGD